MINLSKYIKIIEDISSKIQNGLLKPNEVGQYMKNTYGYDSEGVELDEDYFEEAEKQREESEFRKRTMPIRKCIIEIIKSINEIEQNPNPFTIRFNSKKLAQLFNELDGYKDNPDYERILKLTIEVIAVYNPHINLTKDHIKILK